MCAVDICMALSMTLASDSEGDPQAFPYAQRWILTVCAENVPHSILPSTQDIYGVNTTPLLKLLLLRLDNLSP